MRLIFFCVADVRGVVHHEPMNWLKHYLDAADMKPAELARALGESRQNVSRVMKASALSRDWAERIAPVLKTDAVHLMYGPESEPSAILSKREVASVPVRGQAGAGIWQEAALGGQPALASQYDGRVPAVPGPHSARVQFAYQIVGNSVNKLRIEDGDFVICVPFSAARLTPVTGDLVVVERDRGGLIETTCKQVEVKDGSIELWPRSTDPRFQEPYRIPVGKPNQPATEGRDDDSVIRIVGLVIGRYTPL